MDKKLYEKVNGIKDEMTELVKAAETEERGLTDEEREKYDALMDEATRINDLIEKEGAIDKMKDFTPITPENTPVDEVSNFANYIRASIKGMPQDAASNVTMGDNGAIIPKTIANKVIERVEEISPLFNSATRFNVKGELVIPYLEASNNGISMAYSDEFVELESKSLKLSSITLNGYLAGVLTLVSRSLINNSDFDIVNFVVDHMAKAVAKFFEHEALIGTTGKATGLSTATQVVNTAAATKITTDELIDVQSAIPSTYQANAYWIMNPATLALIRKLKDNNGAYMLNPDIRMGFGYEILGQHVYTSDQMPTVGGGNVEVVYGDFGEALAVKMVEDFELQVLNEKYATQHATGLVGWTEFDCKIQNDQAVAVLTGKTTA